MLSLNPDLFVRQEILPGWLNTRILLVRHLYLRKPKLNVLFSLNQEPRQRYSQGASLVGGRSFLYAPEALSLFFRFSIPDVNKH